MYALGQGVPQDDAAAVRWYRLAAEQGHAEGQNSLGFMYAFGRGVPQDDVEAVCWYRLDCCLGEISGSLDAVEVMRLATRAVCWPQLNAGLSFWAPRS